MHMCRRIVSKVLDTCIDAVFFTRFGLGVSGLYYAALPPVGQKIYSKVWRELLRYNMRDHVVVNCPGGSTLRRKEAADGEHR